MNTVAIKKMTLMHEVSRIPETHLDAVMTYLESVLSDLPTPSPQPQSLKGIWRDAGFENITDVQQELHTIRQELQDAILRRTF